MVTLFLTQYILYESVLNVIYLPLALHYCKVDAKAIVHFVWLLIYHTNLAILSDCLGKDSL